MENVSCALRTVSRLSERRVMLPTACLRAWHCANQRVESHENIHNTAHTHYRVVRCLAGLRASESAAGELSAAPRFARTTRRAERRGAEVHLRELENLSGHVARILGLRARAIHAGQARLRLCQSGRR